ncbi:MAG: flagellar hook-basal body complex protein [Alphaproteobacteria bacterium]|nr:flagellar hook-basal body complex protein [Alphaproteobacteria bacterium]
MSIYGAFSPSMFGMKSQSHAMNTIGVNLANANTGGYRARETRFASLVSESLFNESDLGGNRPVDVQHVDRQGILAASPSNKDVGISGNGFFILSDKFDMSGDILYGRDGTFHMETINDVAAVGDDGNAITVRDGYLADKNGHFVLGWTPDANGEFPVTGGTLAPLRIDPYAFATDFNATSTTQFIANLPANLAANETESFTVNIVDSAGNRQPVTINFTKTSTINQWEMTANSVAQVDTVTLVGTPEAGDSYSVTVDGNTVTYPVTGAEPNINAIRDSLVASINADPMIAAAATATAGANGEIKITSDKAGTAITSSATAVDGGATPDNTAAVATTTANVSGTPGNTPAVLTFDSLGQIVTPASVTLTSTFSGATTASFTVDVSELTQFAGDFIRHSFTEDGNSTARMEDFSYDSTGRIVGTFDDQTQRVLYKLPLAVFANANGLEERNGNTYRITTESGDALVAAAGQSGAGYLQPSARELSNVDIGSEFTTMILAQHVYNSSAKAFQTVDEMTEVARDLKR